MKVYIVFKGYWMYLDEVDSVYFSESKANDRKSEILKSSEFNHSYVESYEVLGSEFPFNTIAEMREFYHKLDLGVNDELYKS